MRRLKYYKPISWALAAVFVLNILLASFSAAVATPHRIAASLVSAFKDTILICTSEGSFKIARNDLEKRRQQAPSFPAKFSCKLCYIVASSLIAPPVLEKISVPATTHKKTVAGLPALHDAPVYADALWAKRRTRSPPATLLS